jgi:hypothetical protein
VTLRYPAAGKRNGWTVTISGTSGPHDMKSAQLESVEMIAQTA